MNTVNYMALMREEDDIAATVDSIANLMRYSITEPTSLSASGQRSKIYGNTSPFILCVSVRKSV